MARNAQPTLATKARELLFVGGCAAVFVTLAACAVYAVVMLAG
jgi:hypothetical protein